MKKSLIYPALKVVRKLPPNYEEMHPTKVNFIHLEEIIPPIYLVEIENVHISPFGAVYKNGLVVSESLYSMTKPSTLYLSFYKKLLLNKKFTLNGNCTIAHNSWFENYYHWLLEALPRLFLLKEKASELKLILNINSPNFINQYVDLFGFKEIVYVEDDKLVKAEKIIFPTYTARGLAMYDSIIRDMVQWLFKQNDIQQNLNPTKKIFITRKNAKYRKLLNEVEVIDYLTTIGFEIVLLENLTVKEQMQLFADAKYVVGTQGAGMANMIYSTHGQLLITIIHEEHQDDAYYNQTNINNTACYFFQCKGAGKLDFKNNDDISVDINKFMKVCEQYILE